MLPSIFQRTIRWKRGLLRIWMHTLFHPCPWLMVSPSQILIKSEMQTPTMHKRCCVSLLHMPQALLWEMPILTRSYIPAPRERKASWLTNRLRSPCNWEFSYTLALELIVFILNAKNNRFGKNMGIRGSVSRGGLRSGLRAFSHPINPPWSIGEYECPSQALKFISTRRQLTYHTVSGFALNKAAAGKDSVKLAMNY